MRIPELPDALVADKSIPWATWRIAVVTLEQFASIHALYTTQQRVNFHGTFPVETRSPETREFLRQLEIQRVQIQEQLFLLENAKVGKRTLWQRIRFAVWCWATQEKRGAKEGSA